MDDLLMAAEGDESCMKGIRTAIGFASIGLFLFILLKACAAGWGGSLWIGSAGQNTSEIFFAMLMLVAGTIAIAGRAKAGCPFAGAFYLLGAAEGVFAAGDSVLMMWCGAAAGSFAAYFFIDALLQRGNTKKGKHTSDRRWF